MYADSYGLTLDLIPMLLGFFTYKMAVIGRQGLAVSCFVGLYEVSVVYDVCVVVAAEHRS